MYPSRLRGLLPLALIFTLGLPAAPLSGCAAPKQEVRKRKLKRKVKRRVRRPSPPAFTRGPLQISCETGAVVEGCNRLKTLDDLTAALTIMHGRHMSSIELAAATLSTLLDTPEAEPRANITIYEPDTRTWEDPQGEYPSLMTVRLDYDRGLERLGEDMVGKVTAAVKALKKTVTDANNEWNSIVVPTKIKIPYEISAQRQMAKVQVIYASGTLETLEVPSWLAKRYIKREARPWMALASHVITSGALKHRLVKQHVLFLTPALEVTEVTKKGQTHYAITEAKESRQRKDLTSMVGARDFCKELRAELRFARVGSWPAMKASFPTTTTVQGGAQ